jgi:hypothetical protein
MKFKSAEGLSNVADTVSSGCNREEPQPLLCCFSWPASH